MSEILGEPGHGGGVKGAVLQNLKSGETTRVEANGVFIAIGHKPNTEIVKGQIELDEFGCAITKKGTATSVPGLFAAGDVADRIYRQAVTAAGTGCMAAIDAERFLSGHG